MTSVRITIAAFVAHRQEIEVFDRMVEQGYAPLLPMATTPVRHARRTMIVDRPVFPRYLFVGIPDGMSWYPLKAIPGVQGIISGAQEPRPVPGHTLALLREADEVGAWRSLALEHGSPELRAFIRRTLETLPGQRISLVLDTSKRQLKRMVDEVETPCAA